MGNVSVCSEYGARLWEPELCCKSYAVIGDGKIVRSLSVMRKVIQVVQYLRTDFSQAQFRLLKF